VVAGRVELQVGVRNEQKGASRPAIVQGAVQVGKGVTQRIEGFPVGSLGLQQGCNLLSGVLPLLGDGQVSQQGAQVGRVQPFHRSAIQCSFKGTQN